MILFNKFTLKKLHFSSITNKNNRSIRRNNSKSLHEK